MAGSAAAFGLSQKGRSCLLVEKGDSLAPWDSSSMGDSRMYRQMYSDPFFSKMQTSALRRWRDVERLSGERLLQRNGLLFYGEDTGETVEGSVVGAKQTMQDLGLPHTYYKSGDEIASAFPALKGCRGKPGYSGVHEDAAGHVRATKACQVMVDVAGHFCQTRFQTRIVALDFNASTERKRRIRAVTGTGEILEAENCILAAGAWTNQVLEMAGLPRLDLKLWQIQWGHYQIDDHSVASSIPQAYFFRAPVSRDGLVDGGLYYVFPASATEYRGDEEPSYVKVGMDFQTGKEVHDMTSFSYESSQEVLQLMDQWVKDHLPGVGKRVQHAISPYTMTRDLYFVMDTICDGVAIFAGGNGRAFKFAPLIGDCLASLIVGDKTPPIDLTSFSFKRPAVTGSKGVSST